MQSQHSYHLAKAPVSMKELSEKELLDEKSGNSKIEEEKYGLVGAIKLLSANKYYLMICGVYILQQIYTAILHPLAPPPIADTAPTVID